MKICSNHQDYQVPLIWTFAWHSYEYWCPYCDEHEEMFGAGENVDETKVLTRRENLFEKASKDYLKARGTLICAKTKWKGEFITPDQLPKEEIERLQKVAKIWESNIKVENLENEK